MYNRDKRYYIIIQCNKKILLENLNIHYVTFNKHLNNGTYYLGKYLFYREPVLTAKVKYMSDLDLVLMLEKDRIKFIIKYLSLPLSNKVKEGGIK